MKEVKQLGLWCLTLQYFSYISLKSVLLVGETKVPREKH